MLRIDRDRSEQILNILMIRVPDCKLPIEHCKLPIATYIAFSSVTSSCSTFFASPNSIEVFGR